MHSDSVEAAQAFVAKTLLRHAGVGRGRDPGTVRAKADAAHADEKRARHVLLAAGLDLKPLDALAAERAAARRERAEQARRRAIEASGAVAHQLAALTPVPPPHAEPMNVIIDRVTFIRSFIDAGVVLDSEINALDCWARYRLNSNDDRGSGVGRLSFFTLWQNPRSEPVVVSAGARLVVNAHLSVDAEWSGVAAWFLDGAEARATVRARTTVWAMWDSRISAIVQDRVLGDAGASGGFFGDDDSASIAFNEFLPASGFVVPAQAFILIEVALLTEWVVESGSIHLDAESGAFRVTVPHLILTLT